MYVRAPNCLAACNAYGYDANAHPRRGEPADPGGGERREEAALGALDDYGTRFYSPVLGCFIQPDTLVPHAANPQSLNR